MRRFLFEEEVEEVEREGLEDEGDDDVLKEVGKGSGRDE